MFVAWCIQAQQRFADAAVHGKIAILLLRARANEPNFRIAHVDCVVAGDNCPILGREPMRNFNVPILVWGGSCPLGIIIGRLARPRHIQATFACTQIGSLCARRQAQGTLHGHVIQQ